MAYFMEEGREEEMTKAEVPVKGSYSNTGKNENGLNEDPTVWMGRTVCI